VTENASRDTPSTSVDQPNLASISTGGMSKSLSLCDSTFATHPPAFAILGAAVHGELMRSEPSPHCRGRRDHEVRDEVALKATLAVIRTVTARSALQQRRCASARTESYAKRTVQLSHRRVAPACARLMEKFVVAMAVAPGTRKRGSWKWNAGQGTPASAAILCDHDQPGKS